MKTREELDRLLNSLYWHVEHAEHKQAIEKLMRLQTDTVEECARAIQSDNPLACSPFTDGRNECCRIIRNLAKETHEHNS